jgi:hypothetical protein
LADLPAAHATVADLEGLSALKSELKLTQDNSALKDSTIDQQVKVLSDTKAELLTCQRTQTDATRLCKAQVAEAKATARKHTIWWAVGAFVGGLITGRKL